MEFVREYRVGSAELDARDVEPALVPACEAEAGRYRDALDDAREPSAATPSTSSRGGGFGPDRAGHLVGDPRRRPADRHPSRPPAAARDGSAIAPAPVRPLAWNLAARVRLRAGPRAPPRRARRRVLLHRSVGSRARRGRAAPDRDRRADRVPDRLGGRCSGCGRGAAIPPTSRLCGLPRQVAARLPALVDRRRAVRPGRRRRARPASRRGRSPATSRPARPPTETDAGRRGLLTFAIDTELLGHWWWEGPIWLEQVLIGLPAAGVRPI